jgi:uncharacterized protein (TIGR02145 family)
MKKSNQFRSSEFHMDRNDILHMLIKDETYTGNPPEFVLLGTPKGGGDMEDFVPNTPTASPASDITVNSFTANWNFMENSNGYYLDVAEDSTFTVMVVTNHDCGNDISHPVGGLDNLTTYYYRIRAYNDVGISDNSETITVTTELEDVVDIDGNHYTYVTIGTQQWMVENFRSEHYADGEPIPIISNYNDWFLPSKDELNAMYTELHLFGIGGFGTPSIYYWSSSEFDIDSAWFQRFEDGAQASNLNKSIAGLYVRACRSFTAAIGAYALRDVGIAGGWIFWTDGAGNYLEAAPTDQSVLQQWSNIELLIGTTGTAIGTGQANTTAIIGQVGHTDSAAKLCDDLTSDMLWAADTTGAYCWYNNDIANKADYGALYNWYAVDNAHGLAPIGWIVPSYTDYEVLWTFIGGLLTAGKKLKKSGATYWFVNTGTDDYGFAAVAGGHRQDTGVFGGDGPPTDLDSCDLWTTTEFNPGTAYYCQMNGPNDEFPTIEHAMLEKTMGMSVRCMRYI